MTQDCAGAALLRKGRVLLGRRAAAARSHQERWDVLGGHLEPGESFDGALVREVEEEAGVIPTGFREFGRHPLPGGEFRLYVVTGWSGGEPRVLGGEHAELRWFPLRQAAALPDLASDELARVFRALQASSEI